MERRHRQIVLRETVRATLDVLTFVVVKKYVGKIRHFLVGDLVFLAHGKFNVALEASRSLLVLPISCVLSFKYWLTRKRLVLGLAPNGHMHASHSMKSFEPLKRLHRAGRFGNARVVFICEQVGLGARLWNEVRTGSSIDIAKYPRLYRCMPPNRFVERLYLPVGSEDYIHACELPAAVPPSFGLPMPQNTSGANLGNLTPQHFVLMQIQRPEMWKNLQIASSKNRILPSVEKMWEMQRHMMFPQSETYKEVQTALTLEGCPTVNLWETVGDPADLILNEGDKAREADQLQTWLFSNCEIFLSGASGSFWIAWALGRPTLYTDSYDITYYPPKTMLLPKLLWDRSEKKLVTISQIGHRQLPEFIIKSPDRYEVISNTSEEIVEAVRELQSIIRGEAVVDRDLQERVAKLTFSSMAPHKYELLGKHMPLIGQGFLRRHPEILA